MLVRRHECHALAPLKPISAIATEGLVQLIEHQVPRDLPVRSLEIEPECITNGKYLTWMRLR